MFDKTKALDVFKISEKEYDGLLREFIIQTDEKMAAVAAALETDDTETAAREIHSFKGVAGNMRLDDCYHAVMAVESALRAHDSATAKRHLIALMVCVDDLRANIR